MIPCLIKTTSCTDMIISIFKFFVEKIYSETVAYNRAYGKSTRDELSDIKCRQFLISWFVLALPMAFVAFFVGRYVMLRSLTDMEMTLLVVVPTIVVTIFITRKLNKLDIYEQEIEKVEKMDKKQRVKYRWRSALIGAVRVLSVLFSVYGVRWLLITFF